jgi:hypothetical protein
MNSERLTRIEQELGSLKKSVRRWRSASALLLVAAGLVAANTAGPTVLDHLIVNRIDVLGEAGSPVISIAPTTDGGRIDLYNQTGTNLLRVSCAPNGGDVAVWDDDGTNVAGIWSTPEGGTFSLWNEKGEELSQFASGALTLSGANASLHIQNESGLPVAVVASDEEGHGRFQIADALGNVVSEMRMLPGVGGGIIVNTTAGKKMGVLAASESGGHLNLFNSQNVPIFVASSEATGGGAMTVSNQRGIPVITLKSDEDHRGMIEIRDEDGNGIRRMRPLRGYSP